MKDFLIWGFYDLFGGGIVRSILGSSPAETTRATVIGIGLFLCILIPYLLGSINWALVISKLVFHDDVRRYGSGNAGTTNVLRTFGRKAGILTFVGDALKGSVSVLFACALFGCPSSEADYLFLITAAYMAAFFCIFGHVFPCFARFKGGKGFATLAGVVLVLNPPIFLILFALYVALVLMTHYISLCSIIAALLYPFILSTFDTAFTDHPRGINVLFSLMMGFLITWCHRSNIQRLWEGTERKFYLFGHKKAAPAKEVVSDDSTPEESEHNDA